MFPKRPGKAIVFLTLAATALLYLLSKDRLSDLAISPLSVGAQIAALSGFALFACSLIIASRAYAIEEAFGGLDHAYRFHHKIGEWSFGLLAAHAVFVGARSVSAGQPLWGQLTAGPTFIFGAAGLALMAAIILVIIFAKIRYQNFVLLQKFFVLPYSLGIWHLSTVNSDISRYAPLRLFIITLGVVGLIAWLYREFFYRQLGPRASYAVKSVEDKGAGIVEIALAPKGEPLRFRPGQFAYFSFRSGAVPSESHPFSFSSAPGEQSLRFAAKALGDYTELLKLAKPGDEVAVYGPYGKFFERLNREGGKIFIAGGIGITPFLSAVRGREAGVDTTVIYTTKSDGDCVYNQELFSLSEGGRGFRYLYHDSDRRGFLSADIVEKRSGGLEGKDIYLCGPVPMMNGLASAFRAKGVPKDRIFFESFSY